MGQSISVAKGDFLSGALVWFGETGGADADVCLVPGHPLPGHVAGPRPPAGQARQAPPQVDQGTSQAPCDKHNLRLPVTEETNF